MKLIFLDIDGVMNNSYLLNRYGMDTIGKDQLAILKRVIEATGAKIVLSSAWRILAKNRKRVREALATVGLEYIDVTPQLLGPRSREIHRWLEGKTVEKFAILDDDIGAEIPGHYFRTDFHEGLTNDIADRVIEYLSA